MDSKLLTLLEDDKKLWLSSIISKDRKYTYYEKYNNYLNNLRFIVKDNNNKPYELNFNCCNETPRAMYIYNEFIYIMLSFNNVMKYDKN